MYEAYPKNTADFRELLVVSNRAAHGVMAHANAIQQGNVSPTYFEENIMDFDPFLYDVMESIVAGWDFSDEDAGQFRDGFSVTYTALLYGAELLDTELPETDELVGNGYISGLIRLGDQGTDYCSKKAQEQTDKNSELTTAWADYCTAKYGEAYPPCFVIGGVIAHDIVGNQVNMTHAARSYSSSIN